MDCAFARACGPPETPARATTPNRRPGRLLRFTRLGTRSRRSISWHLLEVRGNTRSARKRGAGLRANPLRFAPATRETEGPAVVNTIAQETVAPGARGPCHRGSQIGELVFPNHPLVAVEIALYLVLEKPTGSRGQ